MRWMFVFAGLSGACAVGMGAGAAHGLSALLTPEGVAWVKTGAEYQISHSLLLGVIAALFRSTPSFLWAAFATTIGIILFCGSLFLLAFTGVKTFAAVTPFGGLALIAGWLAFAWAGGRMVVDGQNKAA